MSVPDIEKGIFQHKMTKRIVKMSFTHRASGSLIIIVFSALSMVTIFRLALLIGSYMVNIKMWAYVWPRTLWTMSTS